MQKSTNLLDLVKSFPTNIFLQKLASIEKRTSPVKFAHLAEKSEKGSISNLSTKATARRLARRRGARLPARQAQLDNNGIPGGLPGHLRVLGAVPAVEVDAPRGSRRTEDAGEEGSAGGAAGGSAGGAALCFLYCFSNFLLIFGKL